MSQYQFAVIVSVIQIVFMLVFMQEDLGSGAKSALVFALLVFRKQCSANCCFMDVAKAVFIYARLIGCIIHTNFCN